MTTIPMDSWYNYDSKGDTEDTSIQDIACATHYPSSNLEYARRPKRLLGNSNSDDILLKMFYCWSNILGACGGEPGPLKICKTEDNIEAEFKLSPFTSSPAHKRPQSPKMADLKASNFV